MSLISTVGQAWYDTVFGSSVLAGLFVLFMVFVYGSSEGWGIEMFIIVLFTTVVVLVSLTLPIWMLGILLIAMGLIAFIAVKKWLNI